MSDRTIPDMSVVSDGNEKSIDAATRFLRAYSGSPFFSDEARKHFRTILVHLDARQAKIEQLEKSTKPDDFTGLLGELLHRIVRLENAAHHHGAPNYCRVIKL